MQVSQSRRPCWKLNLRFAPPDMAGRVQHYGRTGWPFRVQEPGTVSTADRAVLVARVRNGDGLYAGRPAPR